MLLTFSFLLVAVSAPSSVYRFPGEIRNRENSTNEKLTFDGIATTFFDGRQYGKSVVSSVTAYVFVCMDMYLGQYVFSPEIFTANFTMFVLSRSKARLKRQVNGMKRLSLRSTKKTR